MDKLPKIPQAPDGSPLRVKFRKDTLAFYDVIIIAAVIMALGLSVIAVQFSRVMVQGASMEPTLHHRQILLMRGTNNIRRDDIIVFHNNPHIPHSGPGCEFDLIKRVVAAGGDTVEFVSESGIVLLYVNSERVIDDRFAPMNPSNAPFFVNMAPLTIPRGYYFVLGDNRNNSTDSRNLGSISHEEVIARIVLIPNPDGIMARILSWFGE